MSSLSDAYDRDSRERSVTRALLLLAGSAVAAVGFTVTAASLIAGLGVPAATALEVAALLGGALPLAAFLVPRARASAAGGPRSLALAGVAAVAGCAGLALFWVTLPAGWTGDLARLSPVALGTYAAGLVAAFGARLAADAEESDGGGSRRSGRTRSESASRNSDSLGSVSSASRFGGDDSERVAGGRSRVADSPSRVADSGAVTAPESATGGDGPPAAAVGDGGEPDDDVRFFDDEES
ncbi:DUF7139 domain-containing protein [Halorussus litoreus]|uniref:DUF7139 domain-containing protein n=1 Tax=Halorussus litoreus TaxID=1710536 RepID=UPI000E26AE40|nr:hypothetical protein [Halorussus litoreus]